MEIDERIVIKMPKSVALKANSRGKKLWSKRACMRAVWDARCRILEETGEDIFNVFVMTDCVEISIRGDFDPLHVGVKERRDGPGRPRRKEVSND